VQFLLQWFAAKLNLCSYPGLLHPIGIIMTEMTLFKSHAQVMGYAFKSGKVVHFMNGVYATNSKVEIEELTTECENGHPVYYIDPKQKTVDSEMLDPMAVLRAQIREEERIKLINATSIHRDMGSTDQNAKLTGIATSTTVAGLIVESESQGTVNPSNARPAIQVAPATVAKK
jgi:hypothetical protein